MKKKINNKNKMILNKFINNKKILNNNILEKQLLAKLFDKKVSFSLHLRKYNRSFGVIYNFYYNSLSKLYGNKLDKQECSKDYVLDIILCIIKKYQPNYLKVKTKSNIFNYNKFVIRQNKSLFTRHKDNI